MTLSPIYDDKKVALLKNTLCKGISIPDFEIFLHICKRTGLDPFSKQIYAIPRGNQMTIQTSIDGYRLIAERTGKYAPGKEPTFEMDRDGKLISATAFVKKRTDDGTWHDIGATAYYDEYVQSFGGKIAQFWTKMPRVMLAKCAESLALRRAFPAELSGVYTEDEMNQADKKTEEPEMEIVAEVAKVINFDQMMELDEALESQQDLKQKMLEHAGISSFKDLPESAFDAYMKRAKKGNAK